MSAWSVCLIDTVDVEQLPREELCSFHIHLMLTLNETDHPLSFDIILL